MPSASSAETPAAPGLLLAVTGAPGAGKTCLLAGLIARQLATGAAPADGFLALASGRHNPGQGADEYRLKPIAGGDSLPWAVRDETLSPPYRFEPATLTRLHAWVAALPPAPPLILLDEFGRFEARGEGLLPLWPALCARRPRLVVLSVRDGLLPEIETRLGRRFDLVIDATAPDAAAQLGRACADFGEWTRIGLYGGASGAVELSAGSALHAAKIPLRGALLSSLQAAMMVFTGFGLAQPGRVVWVPFISAGLKALSPAGNRLRPMLAIVAQGLLFGGSVQLLGWNAAAVALGGALIGLWAALQGFALQYLMLGNDLVRAYDTVVLWLAGKLGVHAPGLPWLIAAWAVLHAVFASSACLYAWRRRSPPAALARIIAQESAGAPVPAATPAAGWLARLREFTRWKFWLPLVVVAAILLAGGGRWSAVAWLAFRFVAVGLVLMALVSLLRPARWSRHLRARGWWGPALALSDALDRRSDPR